jgi:aminoglycoside phosphotransferase (APT) family kinase protein
MHGDLHPANLLITKGQLTGVIDFGLLAVGDPAVDLMAAWTFPTGPARHAFRTALPADEATWDAAAAGHWSSGYGAPPTPPTIRCSARSKSTRSARSSPR